MAGEHLNYYYLGHLMTAGLVRLSAVAPDVGYNLAVATFFALSVVAVFGLAYALGGRVRVRPVGAGAVHRGGTVGSGLQLVNDPGPLRDYDWFGASRVITGTINEFPSFSFMLQDLHAHVMAIPFTLLALAFGLQLAIAGPAPPPRGPAALELVVAAIAIGTLYAINAWSLPIVAGLVALGALVRLRDAPTMRERARYAHVDGGGDGARVPGRAAVPAHLRHGGRGLREREGPRPVLAWPRDTGCSTASSPYLVFTAALAKLVRAPRIRGGRRAGRSRRRCSWARCWRPGPDGGGRAHRAVLGRGARGLHDARSPPPSASSGC